MKAEKRQKKNERIISEIADYLCANPTKKMSDVLSYFVVKCRKNRRTVERYVQGAKRLNSERITPQKEVEEPVPAKHQGGRPSQYHKGIDEQVFKLCLLGAKDKEIADVLSISESTLNKWKKEYPEFSESIKRGKEEADANVAASLYSRAKGFVKKDCEKVFQFKGSVVRATVAEYFPPDTSAAIFWLKNRQPEMWRDKVTQTLENPDGTALKLNIETTSGETVEILRSLEEKLSKNEGNESI